MSEVLSRRLKAAAAGLVSAALVLVSPGMEAWAAAGRFVSPGAGAPVRSVTLGAQLPVTPSLPAVPSTPVALPGAAAGAGLPSLPSLPGALPAAPLAPAAGPAAIPAAPAAPAAAAAFAALGAEDSGAPQPQPGGERRWQEGAAKFDGSGAAQAAPEDADAVDGPGWTSPVPSDLKLKPADARSVSKWMADFHAKVAQDYPQYEFTVRDFYAWARFVRFYTPSLGLKEAVTRGAAYVYGDRLENAAEGEAFTAALAQSARALAVSDPAHGKDAALAKTLLALAEPPAAKLSDESSPYQVPVSALVPDAKASDLVMTATTLKRIEAASQAFALRDFALLLGPPATEKSAIPKYLASQHKIPYLAVTMHPGIGVFELVGGYRPRLARAGTLADARAAVAAKLSQDEASGDYTDLLDAAARVYGAKPMSDVLAAIRQDLSAPGAEPLAEQERARRLTTLSYALEHGAQSLIWQDGYLSYAIKNDIWISFEELNAAPTETQEFLNEFMRSRRLAVTQKLGETEVLSPRPGGRFMLWATMNPETDSNREVLAQTLKNRWRIKYFGHLPAIETAEIVEKKFGMPTVWALSLVENFHRELDRQARERVIGGDWRDGYEINLRQLLRTARRWRYFVDQESQKGPVTEARQRVLLAREAYSLYGGMMRTANERAGVFRMLDQALNLSAAGVRSADDLTVKPSAIEDLGDSLRIGDVTLKKGPGGPLVPKPNKDYLADGLVLARLYEYAKALALGEPLLLMGDSAAGKTSDLEYLFFRLNRNLRYKNLDSDTAIEEVIGGFAPGDRKGTFTFQEGLIPKAMEEGSGAFLDEFNLNPLVEWLNTVIDDGKLYLPHRIVDGRAMIVAAANPPDPRYPGRILLSAAARSRYTERWVDVDKSPSRLSELMGHWLKGGAVYALAAAFLSAVSSLHALWSAAPGGSFALGIYQKKDGFPWMILNVAGTVYFFAAAAAHFGNPLGFFAAIGAAWAGIIMSDRAKRRGLEMPLDEADAAALRALFDDIRSRAPKGSAWTKALRDQLTAQSHGTRIQGMRLLEGQSGSDDAVRLLELLIKAETTPVNVILGLKALGASKSPEALPALARLQAALPGDYTLHVQSALAKVRGRQASTAQVQELAKLAQTPRTPTKIEEALSRAEAAQAFLRASADLASRLRAQALAEKAEALSAAAGNSDQEAILLRQLEDLLAAPMAGAQGSAAAGSSWLSRLKGVFGPKKKVLEGVAAAAGPREDDDAPARAPTLEELLRGRGVPEKDWPAVRAKVDRVQTIIKMVGGSVGRDTATRWAPGDLWAFFPDENTVTYPFEDLLTHSEEEIVGLTDHEGGHRDVTVLDQRLPLVKKYFQDPVKHFLWNGFEDPRVNNWDIKRMPGSARYLHAAYDRYMPEDLQARPTNAAPDLSSPQGDGASAFSPEALQYPHVEFIMAGNYYWRYGKKPPKFHNKSAEKAFDQALPEIERIFRNYPQHTDAPVDERAAYSYDTLKRIDQALLPLYEPLVAESQKKMARQLKNGNGKKGKGKGQGRGQDSKGQKKGGGGLPPQEQPRKPKPTADGKPGEEKQREEEKLDPKDLKEALEKLREHARKASEELGGKIEDQPTNKDVRDALKKKGLTPGADAPKPLTLQDIAQTQREQLVNRQASAFDRAFAPVAHLSGAMVTHLENIFQKNARPRDAGWYRTGKRPDVKQFMKRQGEGGLRDDYMLRRAARTKRKYKVTLLIDASGSMRDHAVETSRTAVLLAEALTRLQIDVEVILFSNVARVVKPFDKPMTPENRDAIAEDFRSLIGSLGNGMTHDADALKQALTRLQAQDGDRKFVFVVTDGAGNGPSKLSDALAQAARDRVFVMGVGIGAGMETYVRQNYPRHAVVGSIEALPLKLKEELERYIAEQELAPRAAAAFVPQGQGSAQGSAAFSLPRVPTTAPWRFFYLSWALASAYLLGVMLALTPLLMILPHGMAVSLGTMPGYLAGGVMMLLKMKHGARYPELGPLGLATMCAGLMLGLAYAFFAPLGYILVPAVGGLWVASEAGGMLERRFAPLTAAAERALKAALPASPTAEERAFARQALGLKRSRLAAAASAARAPKRLIPALAVLATGDPSAEVRLAALEALAPSAAFDDAALDALRRGARDGQASVASRAASFLKEATQAREAIPQLPASADLEKLTAGPAADPLELRARALAAEPAATLSERLRGSALSEALRALDAARDAGDADSAAVARRRLEDLLDAARGAQGSGALPSPKGGWRLFFEARFPVALVAWGKLMMWSVLITSGAFAAAELLHPARGLAGPLLVGSLIALFGSGKGPRAYLIARAGGIGLVTALMISAVSGPAPWMAWLMWGCLNLMVAVATLEKTIPGMLRNWGVPNAGARSMIGRARPAGATPAQSRWLRALAGSARARDLAVEQMLAAPSQAQALTPAVAALATYDPERLTPELVELLARADGAAADLTLKTLAARRGLSASSWAREALEKRERAHKEASLAPILMPLAPDADARTLAAARAKLEKPAQTLSARLRAQALREALAAADAASGDERRLAVRRVAALLEEDVGSSSGSAALPQPPPSLRAGLGSALAAGALALMLAAAPLLAAAWALSPLLAAGAGAAGVAAAARSLTRPLDFRDARVAVGPREESAELPEWARAQRALRDLVLKLGLPRDAVPALGLWSDTPGSGAASWNGWSGGLRVEAASVVAVGERWLYAPEAALQGLLAHELGHLATGEQRWRNLWSRLHRAARWPVLGALAFIPAAGWALPVLAAAAWAGSGLLGLLWLRRAELRADRFSAALAGPNAARAFLAELSHAAPAPQGPLATALSDHPSVADRKAALDR